MGSSIRASIVLLLLLTILTGVLYPLAITGVAALLFPAKAGGSLLYRDGQPVGSALIGQPFDDPAYFWSRPSATAPMAYHAAASSGSNLGPLNPALLDRVKQRIESLHQADPENQAAIPVDLVTASASGLDPHITPAAAEYQVARVARRRGLNVDRVRLLVKTHTQDRQLGFLGEPAVNVVTLNLALDQEKP